MLGQPRQRTGQRTSKNGNSDAQNAAGVRPTQAQRRYLAHGLNQPGGKLPLIDRDGREIPEAIIEACVAHGWAQPWGTNPIKPDWLVCRLTFEGYRVLAHKPKDR
jgi:hypothetical protein